MDGLTKELSILTESFLQVDNEDDWMALKDKYDMLVEMMTETRDENGMLLQ